MQKVEAWETTDGNLFRTEGEAVRHDFLLYAERVYPESAVAMMLQEPEDLLRRLSEVVRVGAVAADRAVTGLLGPAPSTVVSASRVGQFKVPVHLGNDVLEVVLRGMEFHNLPPMTIVFNNRCYVGRHAAFDPWPGGAGSPPPVYEWTMSTDESLVRSVKWSKKA